MNIVVAHPPNIDVIDAAFHVSRKYGVIYAYGDTIYNPSGGAVSAELQAHEQVHCDRQPLVGGPDKWWARYIADTAFRLAEELPAHQAEFRRFCKRVANPQKRTRFLFTVAERLSSPLYGRLITFDEALRAIQQFQRSPTKGD